MRCSVLRRHTPKKDSSSSGSCKAGLLARSCRNAFPALSDQLALAYREPASLVVMYSGGLTQKKVIQFCDYLNINDFKKIKTIKTEFSNNPTISYINQDNQEKQYKL